MSLSNGLRSAAPRGRAGPGRAGGALGRAGPGPAGRLGRAPPVAPRPFRGGRGGSLRGKDAVKPWKTRGGTRAAPVTAHAGPALPRAEVTQEKRLGRPL